MENTIDKNIPFVGSNHVLKFGKHKDELLGDVYKNDMQYLRWLDRNEVLKIDPSLLVSNPMFHSDEDDADWMYDSIDDFGDRD